MLDIISVLVTAFLVNPGLGYARLARVPSFSQFQSSNPLSFFLKGIALNIDQVRACVLKVTLLH